MGAIISQREERSHEDMPSMQEDQEDQEAHTNVRINPADDAVVPEQSSQIEITIHGVGGNPLSLLVEVHATVAQVKTVLAKHYGISVALLDICAIDGNEILANKSTIQECGLKAGSQLMSIKRKIAACDFIRTMNSAPSITFGTGEDLWGDEHLFCPRGSPAFVPTHPHILVLVDNCNMRIKVHNTQTGQLLCQMRKQNVKNPSARERFKGSREGEFFYPHGVVVSEDGKYIFVADKDNHRLQVLNLSISNNGQIAEMKFSHSFGREKLENGQFKPTGLSMSTHGTVYVADEPNSRIVEFAPDGTFVRSFGGDNLRHPHDVAVLPSGEVAVVDEDLHQVLIFEADGSFARAFGRRGRGGRSVDGEFQKPSILTSDDNGNLMVLDQSDRLQVFDVEGNHLCTRDDLGLDGTWYKGLAWSPSVGLAIQNSMLHTALFWRIVDN